VELATHIVSAARLLGFDNQACERLNEIREYVQSKAPKKGFTEKNRTFVRQILSGPSWKAVLALPAKLMSLARECRGNAPESAAVYAQMAVAIGILSFAPIRRGNLAKIRLDVNLTKPGGPDSHYWLGFPEYDVKNKVDLTFRLKSPELNEIINEYVNDFRPILLRGHNHDWLFPGQRGGPKEPTSFATQMVKTIFKHTGLRMTVHQFRHAAGALLLQKYPGNYELVRRVLGHRSVQTTIDFYAEFENWQANALYHDVVIEHMVEPEESYGYSRKPRRGPKPNPAAFLIRR
jgi:integrase